jgi:DNA modification methylase
MKPVELVARAIENSSKPKGIVADLFAGAGSTLIAAEQLGRACRAMELEPGYCDVIVTRWEALTWEKAVRP